MAEPKLMDIEVKERLGKDVFLRMLHQWAEGLESNQAFDVTVKGQSFTIPADAASKARLEVEYEIDEGEFELQFTMKWRS